MTDSRKGAEDALADHEWCVPHDHVAPDEKAPDPRKAAEDELAEALHKAGIRCSPNIPKCRASHKGHAKRILDASPALASMLLTGAAVERLPIDAIREWLDDNHPTESGTPGTSDHMLRCHACEQWTPCYVRMMFAAITAALGDET